MSEDLARKRGIIGQRRSSDYIVSSSYFMPHGEKNFKNPFFIGYYFMEQASASEFSKKFRPRL